MKKVAALFCFCVLLAIVPAVSAGVPGAVVQADPNAGGTRICYDLMELNAGDDGDATELPPLKMELKKPAGQQTVPEKRKAVRPAAALPTAEEKTVAEPHPEPLPLKRVTREAPPSASTVSPVVLSDPDPARMDPPLQLKPLGVPPREPESKPVVSHTNVVMPSELKSVEPVSTSRGWRHTVPQSRLEQTAQTPAEPAVKSSLQKGSGSPEESRAPVASQTETGAAYSVARRVQVRDADPVSLVDKKLTKIFDEFYRK